MWTLTSPDKIFLILEVQRGVVISPEKGVGLAWPYILQNDGDTTMNDQRKKLNEE